MRTLILNSTAKSIKAKLSAAATTTNPDFTVAWYDSGDTLFIEGSSDGVLNGTTDVVLVASPAAATQRVVKAISIQNKDTAPVTLTVKFDSGTQRNIAVVTLGAGDTWTLEGTYDSTGSLKQASTINPVNLATTITGAGAQITPLDADEFPFYKVVETILSKVTWANIKATLKTYFDTLYLTATGISILTNKTLNYPNALATNLSYQGETITGTAGESLVFGDAVYFKFSDLKWWKAKADVYATARCKGIAVATIAANASGVILIGGTIRNDSWTFTAAEVWLSAATSGAITSTQPATTTNQIDYIGLAIGASTMIFKPSNDIGEK